MTQSFDVAVLLAAALVMVVVVVPEQGGCDNLLQFISLMRPETSSSEAFIVP